MELHGCWWCRPCQDWRSSRVFVALAPAQPRHTIGEGWLQPSFSGLNQTRASTSQPSFIGFTSKTHDISRRRPTSATSLFDGNITLPDATHVVKLDEWRNVASSKQGKLHRDEDGHYAQAPRDMMSKMEAERWDKDPIFSEVPLAHLVQERWNRVLKTISSCLKSVAWSRPENGWRTRCRESASGALSRPTTCQLVRFLEVSGPKLPLAGACEAAPIRGPLSRRIRWTESEFNVVDGGSNKHSVSNLWRVFWEGLGWRWLKGQMFWNEGVREVSWTI